MKIQKPNNQKEVYHSFADVFCKVMNDDIPVEKAEVAVKALSGMNGTYALEIKRAMVEEQISSAGGRAEIRGVETKPFDLLPEHKR